MDLNLKDFLVELGYPTHKIPPEQDLNDLVRGRLFPIFEDLLLKIKSKQDVNKIRDVLLYNKWKKNKLNDTLRYKKWKELQQIETESQRLDANLDNAEKNIEKLRNKSNVQAKTLKTVSDKNIEIKSKLFLQKKNAEKLSKYIERFDNLSLELQTLQIPTSSEQNNEANFKENYNKFTNSIKVYKSYNPNNTNQSYFSSSLRQLPTSSTLDVTKTNLLLKSPKYKDENLIACIRNGIIPNFNLNTILASLNEIRNSFKTENKENIVYPNKINDVDSIVNIYAFNTETFLLQCKYKTEKKQYNNIYQQYLSGIKNSRDLQFIKSKYDVIGLRGYEAAFDEFAGELKAANNIFLNRNITTIAENLHALNTEIDETKHSIEKSFSEFHSIFNSINSAQKKLIGAVETLSKIKLNLDFDKFNFKEEIELTNHLPIITLKKSKNDTQRCFFDLLNSVPDLAQAKILELFPDAYIRRPEIILIDFMKQTFQLKNLHSLENQEYLELKELGFAKNWQQMLSLLEIKQKTSYNSLKEMTTNFQTLKFLENSLKRHFNFWMNQEMKLGIASSRLYLNRPLMYHDELIRKLYVRKTKDDKFLKK